MTDSQQRFDAEFEQQFETALLSSMPDIVVRPNISANAMACVFFDSRGCSIQTDSRFEDWIGVDHVDDDICAQVRSNKKDQVVLTADHEGRPILLIYAPSAAAKHWPIVSGFDHSAKDKDDMVAIGALSLAHLSDDLIDATSALGMTNLEARVAVALVTQGSMRRAAVKCAVTYHTARKAAAAAAKKAGVSSQTQLVRKLSELATWVSPPQEVVEMLLTDIFGFSLREARLALLLTQGHSRNDAAKAIGLSAAVAKDSFANIFDILGIKKAPEIPRVVMDVFMIALLGNGNHGIVTKNYNQRQPLKLICRPDGSLVAVSDFGPADGKPVLIVHSSLSTRHPFQKLVKTLQKAGYRPITIDRPGFGMTDSLPANDDAFATGTDDVALVFQYLRIEKADIITRGGAFAALALARLHPRLVDRVVVINPDLLHEQCSTRKGNLGIVRSGFDRFPDRIENVTRWLAAQLTPARITKIISMAVKGNAVDLSSFEDPQNLKDYRRSILVFATGRLSGFVREQKAYTNQKDVEGLKDGTDWTLVLGDSDPVHDISEIEKIWNDKIPNATVTHISGAGRFVELSHVDEVVSILTESLRTDERYGKYYKR